MLRIYHIAKIEGKLLERILHIKKKKKEEENSNQTSIHRDWNLCKPISRLFLLAQKMNARQRKRDKEGNEWKIHQLAGIKKKKKKKNRTSRPLSSRWRKERTTKRKKRRYSGDKDRSLTPHCFPFPFYWVTWRDPRSNFPPDSTTSSPFGPRCEKVIRVKLRSRPRIALRHDNTSVIAWQIFF